VTGAAKCLSALGSQELLVLKDPLFLISNRALLLSAGIVELLLAAYLLASKDSLMGLKAIAFLTSLIAIYRLGLVLLRTTKPCGCLGTLTQAIHLSPENADRIMKTILCFMAIGSITFLIKHFRDCSRVEALSV